MLIYVKCLTNTRRRFNDFVKLRTHLEEYLSSRTWKRPVERLPELPGDTFASLLGFGSLFHDIM